MESNILLFCLFALAVTLVIYALPKRFRLWGLLLANCTFYLMCSWKMSVVLLAVILLTYKGSLWIASSEGKQRRRALALTIVPSLLLLFLTKYIGLIDEFARSLLNMIGVGEVSSNGIKAVSILGLSYYVFKATSYAIDVYHRKYEADSNFVNVFVYISFFAHILCGPISRYDVYKENLHEIGYRETSAVAGIRKIILGIFMKAVIADRLSLYVSNIYADYSSAPGLALWMAAIFYAIQLYCDFAGYSYVAIGFTDMLGLRCEVNFNRPYYSRTIKEFWSRWHITLSAWLRDYVYISLGGNRCSRLRYFMNVMLTFLVSGIWHGAGMTFIVWGLLHGLFVYLSPKALSKTNNKLLVCGSVLVTFLISVFLWIFFRSESVHDASIFIWRMFTDVHFDISSLQMSILPFDNRNTCIAKFMVILGFILLLGLKEWNDVFGKMKGRAWMRSAWYIFMMFSILLFGKFGAGFIYGNF